MSEPKQQPAKAKDDITFEMPANEAAETPPVTTDLEFEKYKMKINFLKWVLGTFAVAIMTIIINWGFKDRAAGMDEISQYDKYTTELLVLNDNPVKKRMLAQFFSTVTPSDKLKCGWKDYYKEVDKDYKKFLYTDSVARLNYSNLLKKDTVKLNVADKVKLQETITTIKHNDSIKKVPLVIPQLNAPVKTVYPTVYIQYSNKDKIAKVTAIQKMMYTRNWRAPGIEYKEKGCDNSIRYFNDDDRDMANIANSLLGNAFTIKKVNIQAPKGQIEIWVKND